MRRISSALIFAGLALIFVSLVIFIFSFYPVIFAEVKYRIYKIRGGAVVISGGEAPLSGQNIIKPVDENFGIVIPKIGANSRIVENVDPYNSRVYQQALTRGVAHAKGTVLPGNVGNIFLFSHSSVNFYEANRYNSIFYLLSKMEKDDEVYLFYNKQKYRYKVIDKKIVRASDISYLSPKISEQRLTLMTCWPAGTTLRRLLVIGEFTL